MAARDDSREIREQRSATRYTARWHRAATWALGVLESFGGDVEQRPPLAHSPRATAWRASYVRELLDDDEAESVAIDLGVLAIPDVDRAPRATGRGAGGRRRVIIRLFTWQLDEAAGVLFAPQWITTGEAMTARAAHAAHNRYILAYQQATAKGLESRLLRATAMEVLIWTAASSARYV